MANPKTLGLMMETAGDVLKATDKEEMTLSMNDPLKPVLMKPVGNDGCLCVIMPMRL
jgi:DNA polymerase III sliding clamp (beta) subunit (PCNA family)